MKVEVTKTNLLLINKANIDEVKQLEYRNKKLENTVFV